MRIGLLFVLFFICSITYSQTDSCRTNELFHYLKTLGLASEGDQKFVRCKAILIESNGDGVYEFSLDETDSFTYFYIIKNRKIKFIDSSKIENTITGLSEYLSQSRFPFEKKVLCYEAILQIIKDEKLSSQWMLQEKN